MDTDADSEFLEEIREYLYFFTSDIESESEELDCMEKLRRFIRNARCDPDINSVLINFVDDWITKSFEHLLPSLCHRHYMYRYFGWVADNCFTESENAVLVGDEMGPKPSHRMHVAGDAILQVST